MGDRTARSTELPPAPVRGSARIARPRWLSMADPVSAAVLLRAATRLERAVGFECVAERDAYDWAVVPHALAGVASRVLAPGNYLRQSGRVSGCGASSTLSRRKSHLRRNKPGRESDRVIRQLADDFKDFFELPPLSRQSIERRNWSACAAHQLQLAPEVGSAEDTRCSSARRSRAGRSACVRCGPEVHPRFRYRLHPARATRTDTA